MRLARTPPIVFLLVAVQVSEARQADNAPTQLAQYPGAPHEDRAGNLWFSTVEEGLIRYDGEAFTTFTTKDGLGGDTIRQILEEPDGTLWIATTGGLTKYDGESFTTLMAYERPVPTREFGEQGFHRDLWDVIIDRRGEMWIATMDGVFRYDGKSFVRFQLPVVASKEKSEFTPRMVYCIFEDAKGDLWFGTDGAGAVRYDGTEFVVYTMEDNGLCGDQVCAILQDGRGDYWFGTSNGGVSKFDGRTFSTCLRTKEFSKHTGWGRFMSITEDRIGNVWFGVSAQGGGVYRWDGEAFTYFNDADGLGGGGVPSIREDRQGTMWFGTTAGVYWFDGQRFNNFTRDEPARPVRDRPLPSNQTTPPQ